jgi:hypothetical protein
MDSVLGEGRAYRVDPFLCVARDGTLAPVSLHPSAKLNGPAMPGHLSYPGVYIEELAAGDRSIVPAPTATTAFVGWAASGPVDDPVPIASFAAYEQTFGGLDASSPLGFAVRDYFANGAGAVRTDPQRHHRGRVTGRVRRSGVELGLVEKLPGR